MGVQSCNAVQHKAHRLLFMRKFAVRVSRGPAKRGMQEWPDGMSLLLAIVDDHCPAVVARSHFTTGSTVVC